MKFLSIARPTAAMMMLPTKDRLQLLEASIASMQRHREARRILEWYYSPIGCTIVVLDYNDADEWLNNKASVPILNYVDEELYPLADGMAAMRRGIEALKSKIG